MEIEIADLGVTLDGKKIVEDICLGLKNKEFIGLLGPNGSGKSTILKVLYRALPKSGGNVYFDGCDYESVALQTSAQKLGVMKQSSQLLFDFKVLDIVLLGRTPYKKGLELDNLQDRALALNALKIVGMETYAERSWHGLSGGEQQRVMAARVMAGTPQTLLLDELTNHLDIYYQFHLLDIIKKLHIETLAVMHDLNMAARYCDKLYFLDKGKIVACGRTKEVLSAALIKKIFKVNAEIYEDRYGNLQVCYQGI